MGVPEFPPEFPFGFRVLMGVPEFPTRNIRDFEACDIGLIDPFAR